MTIYQKRNILKEKVFEIEFYRLPNGKVPVEIFLDGLNIKIRNKVQMGSSKRRKRYRKQKSNWHKNTRRITNSG